MATIMCIDRINLPTNAKCEINVSVFFELENSDIRAIPFYNLELLLNRYRCICLSLEETT